MSLARVTIRIANTTDVDDIRQCAKLAYQHYIERMQQTPAPMLADFEQQVAQGFVSVAIADDTLAGYVVCYPDGNSLQLENIAVLPEQHGRGIGKLLIKQAELIAHREGLERIALYTNEKMHENLALYPYLGFTETERKTQAGFNRVFFEKRIDLSSE